jgi:hypothetical protein
MQWGTSNNGISENRNSSNDLITLIQKEGTHNLTRNFIRFKVEDTDDNRDNQNKELCKRTYYFQSISALEGYKEFSIEELRRYDLLARKKGNCQSNFGGNNYLSNNNLVSL